MIVRMKTATDALDARWQQFGVLCACFFLSGATGLVYQVVWLRMLGLIFGHTVHAITAVLAAFMAGLALGSFLFARWSGRIRNLIAAYGWLELGIGVYCVLIPLLLWAASSIYLRLHAALGLSYDTFSFMQFLVVFAILLVPTTLMGGTLPVLSQALATDKADLARKVGFLYAVNTFGAVAGVALAGYVVIPAFGNRITIALAALGNLAVGTLAILYSRRKAVSAAAAPPPPAPAKPPAPTRRRAPAHPRAPAPTVQPVSRLGVWLTVAALAVSGAVSMVYEVTWTRALTLVIGSSTYAFSAMLLAFLIGIAGGSALYSWAWGTRRGTPAVFAVLQVALALAVLATTLLFEQLPFLFLAGLKSSVSPGMVRLVQVIVSACALLPSTLLIGATFPCAVAVAAQDPKRVGRDVGDVYALNTVGAIVGVALVGFVLIPAVGVHTAIKIGILVNLVLAAVLLVPAPRLPVAWGGVAACAVVAIALIFVPPWDPRVMGSGPAIYGPIYLREAKSTGLGDILRRAPVVYYRDGVSATVTVEKEGTNLSLRSNGKVEASTLKADMPTQLLLAHIPLLVHPNPKDVLVIGLGSGITVGAAARHNLDRLDVVEIEPAVVEASDYFAPVHGNVLKQPRVRTVIADGRNFLLTTPQRYDVIISQPSNPWIGGLASLFSIEFFELARQRLKPGGLMVQWVQGYSLLPEDLQMVVRTFRTVFPATTLWHSSRAGDYVVVGRTEPVPLDADRIRARYDANPAIREDLAGIGMQSWPAILGYFMLDAGDVERLAAGTEVNTDDRLPLEFRAPRGLYTDTTNRNLQVVRAARGADLPAMTAESRGQLNRADARYAIGLSFAARNLWEEALGQFQKALELDPAYTPARLRASEAYIRTDKPREAAAMAEKVLERDPSNAEAAAQVGVAYSVLNDHAEAVKFLERAAALQPQNAGYRRMLERARSRAAPTAPAPETTAGARR